MKLLLFKKPYNLFLTLSCIIFLISFFPHDENSVIDLHVHDTYFVIANAHVLWMIAILLLLLWFIYLISKRILYSKILSWLHVVCTIIGVLILCIFPFIEENLFNSTQKNYSDIIDWERRASNLDALVFIIFFGQFILVFHFIVGLVKLLREK